MISPLLRRSFTTTSILSKRLNADANPNMSDGALAATFLRLTNSTPTKTNNASHVRLSKRLSELNLCSRREADAILKENGPTRVFVDGVDVTNVGVGQKISQNTTDITLGKRRDATAKPVDATEQTAAYTQWSARRHETIVLNKPIGYVSGTPQFATQRGSWTSKIQFYDTGRIGHAYKPAIQLVHGESFYKSAGSDFANPSEGLVKRLLGKSKGKGLAPAGRLDINSSGLLLLTRDGVMARMLVTENCDVEKEYLVRIAPQGEGAAVQAKSTRFDKKKHHVSDKKEAKVSASQLRRRKGDRPDLQKMIDGRFLKDEAAPLKDVVECSWVNDNQIKVVLKEGRKRQVRRMVEEFLKLTVVELRRVRIGPISLGALPQGKWRFLSDREGEEMMHLVGTTGDERRESIEGARMAENAGFAGLKRSK